MTVTVEDFKSQFVRDFPYLPVWDSGEFYNTDEEVYYAVNRLFYKALNDGVTSIPTTVSDWEKISDSIENYIQDSDIERAFEEATASFNTSLFGDTDIGDLAYTYLAAHYLVMDSRAAVSGLTGTGTFNESSKSVGSVSISYQIPQAFQNDPIAEYYSKTPYGQKYLSFLLPRIIGNVQSVEGGTKA